MIFPERETSIPWKKPAGWPLAMGAVPLLLLPFFLSLRFPGRRLFSLPLHTTLEMAGATLGLALVALFLFSRQKASTSRRMWISLAVIAMAVFDTFHSCVPPESAFVWFHSLSVLAGGIFFAMAWLPNRTIDRSTALAAAYATLLAATLIGIFSLSAPETLPVMITSGGFTPLADTLNLLGGGLTLCASANFAIHFARNKRREELLFFLLTLLFGLSGVLFHISTPWQAGWWTWHVLRFTGYLTAFALALIAYRRAENDMIRTHTELDTLFQVGVDAKRLVDKDFNQVRANDTLLALSGPPSTDRSAAKCHEAFGGPLCHTEECPLTQLKTGPLKHIQKEMLKHRPDGTRAHYILNAIRLEGADGSFAGIIESFWDITDRKKAEQTLEEHSALKTGQTQLADLMQGDLEPNRLCRNIITFLCKYMNALTGLIYLADEKDTLTLVASYAHKRRKHLAAAYRPGEGLVGQAALEREEILLTGVPEDYITIESGLGVAVPRVLLIKPAIHNDQVKAVLELGSLTPFTKAHAQFLNSVTPSIALALENAQSRTRLTGALEESRALSEKLTIQQEELQSANEELEEQTTTLTLSEEKLKEQQEELQSANEELEEKNNLLEAQKQEMLTVKQETEKKAAELALASRYKSEFLANMSHELRTPLNSLLLLAQSLTENKEGNLTPDQTKAARVIHAGGTDLLNLINEILDLSKIEAGRMDLAPATVPLDELAADLRAGFQHMAREKSLDFTVCLAEHAPPSMVTDRKRLDQILKNLVANAIKFTDEGRVAVTLAPCPETADLSESGLRPENALAVTVADTGIGIAHDQQRLIFEAFQQADGTTTRRYGGTGLGLSISRELARLLGGEIQLMSEPGQGATFTLYLPRSLPPQEKGPRPGVVAAPPSPRSDPAPSPDDRDKLGQEERAILVIEDDPAFAECLYAQCHEKGFDCLIAHTGEAGLELASEHLPRAVLLDIQLPGMDGWAVLAALKENLRTRHIPVHVLSVTDATTESIRRGAVGHTTKPISREGLEEAFARLEGAADETIRRVLIVDGHPETRRSVIRLIAGDELSTTQATSGAEGLNALRAHRFDCVILDPELPDMDGLKLLRTLVDEGVPLPPVIIHTARDLTAEEEMGLREHAESIILKDVRSEERLLDEVSLFLHQVVNRMPDKQKQIITSLHDTDTLLKGKKVLIVDDDMRTTFALSKLLCERGMTALKAENGERALSALAQNPDVHLVLMDIMMPVMDGYETMERIRAQAPFRTLPIIALTAKAMKEDQQRCLACGANDYMPKPVDPQRLISMMRVWLYR